MALRDAVRAEAGAQLFAEGLYNLLYGAESMAVKFERWCETVASSVLWLRELSKLIRHFAVSHEQLSVTENVR